MNNILDMKDLINLENNQLYIAEIKPVLGKLTPIKLHMEQVQKLQKGKILCVKTYNNLYRIVNTKIHIEGKDLKNLTELNFKTKFKGDITDV